MAKTKDDVLRKARALKKAFFACHDKEFLARLLGTPRNRRFHQYLTEQDVGKLYNEAIILIHRVERGFYKEKDMEKVELKIAHLLAAIEDSEFVNERETER